MHPSDDRKGEDQPKTPGAEEAESSPPMDFTANYPPVDHYSMLDYYADDINK